MKDKTKALELQRQEVWVSVSNTDEFDTVAELIDFVDATGIDYKNLIIKGGYSCSTIGYYRPETDEEYEKRVKPYTTKLKKREEDKYKQYLKLKEKFEAK